MNRKQANLLLKVADHLENEVDDVQFFQGRWKRVDPVCGTQCCVLGHACAIKEVRDAGVSLRKQTTNGATKEYPSFFPILKGEPIDRSSPPITKIGQKVFGLNVNESDQLFYGFVDSNKQEKVDQIRSIVSNYFTVQLTATEKK